MVVPVNANSIVLPYPTILGSLCREPRSATIPRSTSLTEKLASLEHNRMSHPVIMSTPPPMQAPWMATMTGIGDVSKAVAMACKSSMVDLKRYLVLAGQMLVVLASWMNFLKMERSRPVQKLGPLAVRRRQWQVDGSRSWMRWGIVFQMSALMELPRLGLLRVM